MARAPLTATVTLRWWLKHYMFGVMLMAKLTGRKPDWARFHYWVRKGVKVEFR